MALWSFVKHKNDTLWVPQKRVGKHYGLCCRGMDEIEKSDILGVER